MDRKEFQTFAMALRTYFPKEKILPNQQAVELWYRQLYDIDYRIAEIVLNKWVSNNKWSPSIADIREQAVEVTNGRDKDWGEAWEDVMKNIRKFGYYRAEEAVAAFTDDLTRETVRRLGYTNLCLSSDITIDRANFRMIYENLAQRQKSDRQISKELMHMIQSVQVGLLEEKKDGKLL